MALKQEEITRKLLHVIFGALIPLGILYIPRWATQAGWNGPIEVRWLPSVVLGIFLLGFILVETVRLRVPRIQDLFHGYFGSMLRHEEKHRATGATWINASALLCSIMFVDQPHVSAMVLSLFIWGDAVAALVGQSIGRIRIGKKSLEGSLACFFLCLLMFFFIFPYIPTMLDPWKGHVPWVLIVISSLSITVLELIPMRVSRNLTLNDNLVVPVITGVIMLLIYPFLS